MRAAQNLGMDTAYTVDQIVFRTCQRIVAHIRHHVEEGRGGIHTRLFSHMLHPEKNFVYAGRTMEAGKGNTHPEHVVPCCVLVEETRNLIRGGEMTDDAIAALLQKHWKIVDISSEQAKFIDETLGWRSSMPASWDYRTGDTFARLSNAGIKFLPPLVAS